MTRNIKEQNRSLDLEGKYRPPPEVPSGTTADRAVKHDLQGENPSVETEQKLSKATPAISRKDKSRTAMMKKTAIKLDQSDRVENKIPKSFKFVEDKIKTEWWHVKNWPRRTSGRCSIICYQATQYSKC